MAAGEGRRLRPLTERWPKPILPIDGRPVIARVLRDLAAAGCVRVTTVTGHLGEQVERLLGDGAAFGVELAYALQPRADGSADAVARALAQGATPPLVITTADTVFRRGDVARFANAFAASPLAGAVAVRREPPPMGSRAAVEVERGRALSIGRVPSAFAHASLWGFGPGLAPYLEGLSGPPYELAEAYQRAIDDGIGIGAVEVGRTRDLTDPLDLVTENFAYLAEGNE